MKKLLFPALAILAWVVSACSQKTEYTNAIPAKAETVIAIQPAALADKAGLDETSLQKLKELLKKDTDASMQEYLETLLNDPAQSGIDFESPLYLFNIQSLLKNGFIAVAKVSDEANVQTLVNALQEQGLVSGTTPTDGYTLTEGKLLMAYNASTLLMLGAQEGPQVAALKDSIAVWIQQTAEQSYSSKPAFKQMQEQKGDIKAVLPYTAIPSSYAQSYGIPQDLPLKDISFIAALSFEKGSIDLHLAPYTENADLKTFLEKQAQAALPIKNTFIDYFPQSSLALLSTGMNGAALYEQLLENTAMGNDLSAKEAESMKAIFDMFENDLTVGLVNWSLNQSPAILAYATVKDAAPLKKLNDPALLRRLPGKGKLMELGEDQYVWHSGRESLFFGVRDRQFYATNDELLYKDIFKKCDPSAAETAYADGMKSKKMSIVLNIEAVSELPVVKMLLGLGGAKTAPYKAILDGISYLKSESDGTQGTISLQLKDKDTNALKQIAELGKGII